MGRMTASEARDILEVGPYATTKDVKSAFKRLALACNPDYNEASPESARKFQRINAAYDRLTKDNIDDDDLDSLPLRRLDKRKLGVVKGVVIADRHVTRVHTDDGFFFVLGPQGQFSDSDDNFDASKYTFKLTDGDADEQAKTKAEKNKLKKKRKKENKKQARENFLKEREEIKQERQKTLEGTKTTQKPKTDTENIKSQANFYNDTNEKQNKTIKKVSGLKKEKKTNSNSGYSSNASLNSKNNAKLKKNESQNSTLRNLSETHELPTSVDEPSTKQDARPSVEEMLGNTKQENEREENEALDVDCAFFAKVSQKRKPPAVGGTKPKTKQTDISTNNLFKPKAKQKNEEKINDSTPSPAQVQAQQIASEGNKMASSGNFQRAVELYSQSYLLNPTDHRLLSNRSFCFEKLREFEKALADAEKCISLAPNWSKGYFRKGRALSAMEQFVEAEKAFEHVLKNEKHCPDAITELQDVRLKRLQEMGFSKQQSLLAVKKYSTVDEAVDAMLSGAIPNLAVEDVYVSDEDEICDGDNNIETQTQFKIEQTQSNSMSGLSALVNTRTTPNLTSPDQGASQNSEYFKNTNESSMIRSSSSNQGNADDYNPKKRVHSGVYIGNLRPQVKDESLRKYFGQFGQIQNIQRNIRNNYAYVNYFSIESAMLALETAELVNIDDVSLYLDYPGNRGDLATNKNISNSHTNFPICQNRNDDRKECFLWRGSGCRFGPNCRYLHVAEHQGIDMR